MHLEIITPDKKVFDGEVVSASFPGTDGSFQILNNHAPLVSTLAKGVLNYRDKEENEFELIVDGGVVEVLNNRVNVLIEAIIEEEE